MRQKNFMLHYAILGLSPIMKSILPNWREVWSKEVIYIIIDKPLFILRKVLSHVNFRSTDRYNCFK